MVCRATFQLRQGEATLLPRQEPPNGADVYQDDDPVGSLRAGSDLVPMKAGADVTLVGAAYAPGGHPTRSVVARLAVGTLDKAINVQCDRGRNASGAMFEGAHFVSMPLVYERAAGGPGSWNPVGVQPSSRDSQGNTWLPNLLPRDLVVSSPGDIIAPVGFGPLAPTWPVRLEKLGRHRAEQGLMSWRGGAVPDDLDPAFFNCAPPDQQVQELRDDLTILLENLNPEHPRMTTTLPGIRPVVVIEARGGAYPLPLRCDTLWIDTTLSICTLTWRAQVTLAHATEAGRLVVSMEQAARSAQQPPWSSKGSGPAPVGPSRAASMSSAPPAVQERSGATRTPSRTLGVDPGMAADAKLPFAPSTGSQPLREAAPAQPARGLPFSSIGGERSVSPAPEGASYPALQPFSSGPWAWPSAPAPVQEGGLPSSPGLGVAPVPPAPFLPSAPRPIVDSPWASGSAREPGMPSTVGAAVMAAASAPPALSAAPADRGVLSTSNAAAGPAAAITAPRVEAGAAPRRAAARPAAREEPREVLQIVWFNPDTIPRIRRKAPWRALLEAQEAAGTMDPDVDDPGLAPDPAEAEDRRDVFAILATGEIPESDEVNEALAAGVRDDGRHVPSLVLIAGELSFPFDELETLKATVSTVSPLVGADENLKGTLDVARQFLETPELRSAPGVSEGLTTRIREAFAQGRRAVAPGYLDAQTERVLLEQRQYQRRTLLGARFIRALLSLPGADAPVPTYLPDSLSKRLPLFQRFKARLIVEVQLAVDQYETHPAALEVAALGRLAPAPISTRRKEPDRAT